MLRVQAQDVDMKSMETLIQEAMRWARISWALLMMLGFTAYLATGKWWAFPLSWLIVIVCSWFSVALSSEMRTRKTQQRVGG